MRNSLGTPFSFREIPGRRGTIYAIEIDGEQYRIAPEDYKPGWRLDHASLITKMGGPWDSLTSDVYPTPEAAAKELVQLYRSRKLQRLILSSDKQAGKMTSFGTPLNFEISESRTRTDFLITLNGTRFIITPETETSGDEQWFGKWRIVSQGGKWGGYRPLRPDKLYRTPNDAAKDLYNMHRSNRLLQNAVVGAWNAVQAKLATWRTFDASVK